MARIEGKIYKIENMNEPEKFYIGGTSLPLSERLKCHRSDSKRRNYFFYQEVNLCGGWKNFTIQLVENFPCNSKDELRKEEDRFIVELNPYYNTSRAFITDEERKEYRTKYNEEHKEDMAKYYEEHKEQITKKQAKYYQENKEQIKKY